MKSSVLCAFLLGCLYQTTSVLGYGTGAPPQACETMIPGHLSNGNASDPILPQEGASPYTLAVDSDRVQRGQTVKVTINGAAFKGCLVQARLADGSSTTPIGTFSASVPDNTKTTTCSSESDSVTHMNTNDKPAGTEFTWQAPDDEFNDIVFRATVAQNKETFWVGLQSETITASAPWILSSVSLLVSSVVAAWVVTQ